MSSSISVGQQAPDFTSESTQGTFSLYSFMDNNKGSWVALHFGLAALTPVCSTEMAEISNEKYMELYNKANVKPVAISRSDLDKCSKWSELIEKNWNHQIPFPIVSDVDRKIAESYNALNTEFKADDGKPIALRLTVLIDDTKKIRWMAQYPNSMGRNLDEIVRVINALQVHDKLKVYTPANVIASPQMDQGLKQKVGPATTPKENMPFLEYLHNYMSAL
eukprot:tig00000093_g3467.t1